jgi:signal transduction histidine kinase
MSIVTDSTPVDAPKNPDGSTILQLYALVASEVEVAAMREDFARGGTGYGEFKKRLFERLWDFFAPMRQRRAEISADPMQIMQVFQNLIGNAIKFKGQDKPQIHVSASQSGDNWEFSIRDNGIGFNTENSENIFVIFYDKRRANLN